MGLAESYANQRVFITGHTGFKGAWLAEWLVTLGAEVTGYALDPPTRPNLSDALDLGSRVKHVLGDIRHLEPPLAAFTTVIRAASNSSKADWPPMR